MSDGNGQQDPMEIAYLESRVKRLEDQRRDEGASTLAAIRQLSEDVRELKEDIIAREGIRTRKMLEAFEHAVERVVSGLSGDPS